jgi:hypothetical protein
MIQPISAALATLIAVIGISASAKAYDAWEYQGTASTGEDVYLNLDSIQRDFRGGGYFFDYQIGSETPTAFTPCDGRFQVANTDGDFEPLMTPQSTATRQMLGRVCTYWTGAQ